MKRGWNALLQEILKFRDQRDWKQFHTPKNLAAAIAIEAAELQEHFLWKSDTEVLAVLRNPEKRDKVNEELADVLIFTLLLADRLGVDIDAVVRRKLKNNAKKYPVEKARGNHKKYTELSE
jgi:NTP pyrophosphatase (non-canonical NTP hydrolase)